MQPEIFTFSSPSVSPLPLAAKRSEIFCANGIDRATWMATMGYVNIHGLYIEPSPYDLDVREDELKRERYFWFSETVAGTYEVNVRLAATGGHVGASPYAILVRGGAPVNHVSLANANARVGLASHCLLYTSPSPRD